MRFLDYVNTFSLIIIALVGIDVAIQLRNLYALLKNGLVVVPPPHSGSHSAFRSVDCGEGEEKSGYCVWAYRDGEWRLEVTHCKPGFEPAPAPKDPGEYEGQCVRKLCVEAKS